MKRFGLILGLTAGACKKQGSDNDAIRAGIQQHLATIGTLNMSAMDMDLRSVSVNGNQAHAEVEFRPKSGAAPGSGMQVAYNLEKRDGAWVVLKSQNLGGMQHPPAGQNPSANQDPGAGGSHNFHDILNPAGTPAQGTLPPGHPPVGSQQANSHPSGQKQPQTSKPG